MRVRILTFLILLLSTNAISQSIFIDSLLLEINNYEADSNYIEAKNIITNYMSIVNDTDWFILSKELIYVNEELDLFKNNLSVFDEAHQRGFFYCIHPAINKYKQYKEFDEFISLSQQDLKLREEANDKSKQKFEVRLPDNYKAGKNYPVIFLLHGGGKSINDVKKHWQVNALNTNYIKVYVQSARHFDSQTYGWGAVDEKLTHAFKQCYNDLRKNYSIDTSTILLGGISAGANVAIELALESTIPIKGLIIYCPGMPSLLKNMNIGLIQNYNAKFYIVSGENDHFVPKQKEMIHILDSLNIPNSYLIVRNMGHQYPDNENYYIEKGLKYINNPCQITSELREYIKKRIAFGYNKGISIGIIDKTGVSFYNYGTAYNNSSATPTENTIYEIGSVTKVFTTSLYSILLDSGILDEDAMVGDYFQKSEISGAVRSIRLVDLATHTSGLPVFPSNLNTNLPGNFTVGYSKKDFLEFLNNYNIQNHNFYSYSNTGISLLALVMEKATGKNYDELFREYLSQEIELNSTYPIVPKTDYDRFADGSSLYVKKNHWDISNVLIPDGGMKSTAKDLSRFIQANLQQVSYKYQTSLINAFEIKQLISDSVYSGIGWKITKKNNKRIIWHNGSTGGFASFVGFSPEENKGVVILSNSNLNINDIGWKLLDENTHLKELKRHICFKLNKIIQEQDVNAALEFYTSEKHKIKSQYILGDLQLIKSANAFMTEDINVSNRIFEFALNEYPKSLDVYIGTAKCFFIQENYSKAQEILEKAQKIFPDNVQINKMLKQLEL